MKRKNINILFLGGAKRVSMARMFKAAAQKLGYNAAIYSYELDKCVPVACEATVVEGSRWSDRDVISRLDETVENYKIDIIVPFVDGAVGVAASYAATFPGKVFVPSGSAEAAELMFDKVRAADALEKASFPIPATYHPGDPCMRLIAKPRHGSASKGIIEISGIERLDDVMLHAGDYLVQERIDNREELTVDCYVSVADGRQLVISPRRRNVTVGGEVSDTETVVFPEAVELTRRVLSHFDLRGAVTVQLIHDLDFPGRLLIMEVNPRLGGGAVCTVAAGADIPSLIISEAMGLELAPAEARPGVRICRYMQEVVFVDGVCQSSKTI